jgi:hypothetical protein
VKEGKMKEFDRKECGVLIGLILAIVWEQGFAIAIEPLPPRHHLLSLRLL